MLKQVFQIQSPTGYEKPPHFGPPTRTIFPDDPISQKLPERDQLAESVQLAESCPNDPIG